MASEPKEKATLIVPAAQPFQIHRSMAAILKDCGAIGKERTNTEQKYKFRGIDDVYNELHDVFAKHGVFCMPRVISHTQSQKQAKSGAWATITIVEVEFDFVAGDGSLITCKTVGEAADYGDKSTNKAMSTAQKYALFQVFLIPTEADNDTENSSHEFVDNGNRTATKQGTQTRSTQQVKQAEPETRQTVMVEIGEDWEASIADLKTLQAVNNFWDLNKDSLVKAEKDDEYTKRWKDSLMSAFHGKAKTLGFYFDITKRQYQASKQATANGK